MKSLKEQFRIYINKVLFNKNKIVKHHNKNKI